MVHSSVIIALIPEHLPCRFLPKRDLGRHRTLAGALLRVVGVDLRQTKKESKLPVLLALGPPRPVQANRAVPPAVVVADPVFGTVMAGLCVYK